MALEERHPLCRKDNAGMLLMFLQALQYFLGTDIFLYFCSNLKIILVPMPDIRTELINSNTELSNNIFKSSEILGIFNSILARQSVNARVIYMRGIYLANPKQEKWEYCYDTLRDEDSLEELTLRLTPQQRENLKNGNLVYVGGVLNRKVTGKGFIQIFFKVSRLEVVKEQVIDEAEIKRAELRQRKSSEGFKNVDAIIENLLFADKRPRVALVFPQTSITMSDFEAGINASKVAIDFKEFRVNFSIPDELVKLLTEIDKSMFDAIAIVRGGGNGIEKLDDLNVLTAVVGLETPVIVAVGHVEEKIFIKQLADKCAPTPNGLGQYFSEMVENVNEKKSRSKAALTEQIKKQFKEQLETGKKQNKELQEKLRVLTENQKKATEAQQLETKKHNEQVEAANKLNKELQEKLRILTENQKKATEEQQATTKKHIEQMEAAQKQNKTLHEQLKMLNDSQARLQEQHKKQQEEMNKNLSKMQETNSQLQRNLEKVNAQNAESLRELSKAKERAKDLEQTISTLGRSDSGSSVWGGGVLVAIIIIIIIVVLSC